MLALISGLTFGAYGSFGASPEYAAAQHVPFSGGNSLSGLSSNAEPGVGPGDTQVVGQVTMVATTTQASTSTVAVGQGPGGAPSNFSQGKPAGSGGLIEFSSDLTLRAPSPQQTASSIVALAYTVGGYVAFQSTFSSSANIVIRIPAASYQQVLSSVEKMGTVLVLTSSSNDVRVQYTDLNATLASLRTEQGALLRLLNKSATINSTLAIENQLQGIDQQINSIESQILQTRTLIEYSTINISITQTSQLAPLSSTLSASPTNGTAPLSVTFNAVVKGGSPPYVINFNFGDGSASQGQIVIHTFGPGNYKVVASTTDQNGTVNQSYVVVHAVAVPTQTGIANFFNSVGGLFFSVVEGIVEVAAVVLPIAAVGAAIIIPLQRRGRSQKSVRQPQ